MNQNLAMILFIVLALGIGLAFGWEFKIIWTKGKGSKDLLGTADTVIDGVKSANDTFGKLIPSPIEFIIDKVLQTAQAGVHAAQQLCDSSQLTEDQRKQKAFDSAMNLLKLEGYTTTPELETAVKDAIETGVFVMKNIVKPSVGVPAEPEVPEVPKTVEVAAALKPVVIAADPAPEIVATPPKSIVDVVATTLDQVGEQAKTQARDNLTAKITAVVQEANAPVVTPATESTPA